MTDNDLLRRYRWELWTATWLSYAGFYVTRKVFSVVKPEIKASLALDDLSLSHLFTAYLVTYMLGQFLAAGLGERVSPRRQLLFGMSLSVACNVAVGAWLDLGGTRTYGLILATMAIHGFAQATGWPNNVSLVTQWTGRGERGTVMAFWGTCYQLGAVLAKAFAAFLFATLGLAWSFWGSAAVLACVTALFWFWGHERPEAYGLTHPDAHSTDPTVVEAERADLDPDHWWRWLRLVASMGLVYFSFKFLRYALDSWTSLILVERFAIATSTAGYLSTAFDWVGFLGVIAAGLASDRLFGSRRGPVVFFMTFGAFAATLALWSIGQHSLALFTVLLGVIGFMDMGPDSLLAGAGAVDVGNRRQATMAVGIINGLGSIGPIVQEPLIGWIKSTYGSDAVFLLLVGMTALSLVGTWLLWQSARRAGLDW